MKKTITVELAAEILYKDGETVLTFPQKFYMIPGEMCILHIVPDALEDKTYISKIYFKQIVPDQFHQKGGQR